MAVHVELNRGTARPSSSMLRTTFKISLACCLIILLQNQTGLVLHSQTTLYKQLIKDESSYSTPHHESRISSRPRLLIFCRCEIPPENLFYEAFSIGLKKIPHLVHEIDTHEFYYTKGAAFNATCKDEIEQLLAQPKYQTVPPPLFEVLINDHFDQCHAPGIINFKASSRHDKNWVGGAHIVMNDIKVEPIKVSDWGEVFHKGSKSCSDPKVLNLFRSKGLTDKQDNSCNILHVPTILRWVVAIRKERNDYEKMNETVEQMLTHRLTYEEAMDVLAKKTKFCGLVTFTGWKEMYAVDALVRHALCKLLTKKYKTCDGFREWHGELNNLEKTNPGNTFKIQKDYKFIIAMANEFSDGYLVEKTVHPYLADSIAISASPSIGQYINGNRPVVCLVPQDRLDHVGQWARGNSWMHLHFMDNTSTNEIDPIQISLTLLSFVL